jgi:hypothetical protein
VAPVDEDDGNDGQPIDYGYTEDELNATSANLSIRQQMVSLHCSSKLITTDLLDQASIDHASASHMNELLEHYPMGNNPLFGPNKRIFSNGDRHWELNDLRLRLWGVAKVRKLHLSKPLLCILMLQSG